MLDRDLIGPRQTSVPTDLKTKPNRVWAKARYVRRLRQLVGRTCWRSSSWRPAGGALIS